ncbi:hypothetical protein PUN28_011643 [Cardiocondyla obscurior]|uniref:Uncharacterized protein n=1 Tax=Cardiocondyla obscurior TaxID=286306 RepID=A0AAW2FIA6_9HYME
MSFVSTVFCGISSIYFLANETGCGDREKFRQSERLYELRDKRNRHRETKRKIMNARYNSTAGGERRRRRDPSSICAPSSTECQLRKNLWKKKCDNFHTSDVSTNTGYKIVKKFKAGRRSRGGYTVNRERVPARDDVSW